MPSEKAILCPRQTIFSFSAQAIAKLGDKVIKLRDRLVSLRVRSRKQAKLIKSLIQNEQYCAKSLILNEQKLTFSWRFLKDVSLQANKHLIMKELVKSGEALVNP